MRIARITIIFFALFFAVVADTQAAGVQLKLSPQNPGSGQEFAIGVYLSADVDFNAAEGSIVVPPNLSVRRIHTGGSAFSLWPAQPQYYPASRLVEFAGGSTQDVFAGNEILLFTILLTGEPGMYTISARDVRVFKNDGDGTPNAVPAASAQFTVRVLAEDAEDAPDTSAPEFVSVEIGQEPSLFGGRKYLVFVATDDRSGVTRYEVKEGWLSVYRPVERYYVPKDQSLGTDLWVRATDASGNSVIQKIPAQGGHWVLLGTLMTGLLGACIIYALYVRRCSRKHHA